MVKRNMVNIFTKCLIKVDICTVFYFTFFTSGSLSCHPIGKYLEVASQPSLRGDG